MRRRQALLLAVSLIVTGCADEAEVTTEYLNDESADPFPSSPDSRPGNPAPGAGGDSQREPPASSEEEPSPPASLELGSPSASAPAGEETPAPIPLAALARVPDSEHCAAVSDWDPLWVQFEEEVLLRINEARSQPADCGEEGLFPAAEPLVMEPRLRCSARLHSLDMFERHFFNHDNPDGRDPFERIAAAGFRGGGAAENIAVGQTSPAQVTQSWMDSDSHCSNVMRRSYTMLGVGYHPGLGKRGIGSNYWTQNFGAPPRSCSRNCR